MAETMKKKNTTTVKNTVSTKTTELKKAVKENEATQAVVEKKKFENTDEIACRSITVGGLFMEGIKTGMLYEWADEGDVTMVEYQDLVAAIRTKNSFVMKPLFIIDDEDVIALYPQLNKVYEALYSVGDLRELLLDYSLNAADMKETIARLPEGAKNSVKNIASQLVSTGQLDSLSKIRALDELFDTEFTLMTELFRDE